jgi:cysteinyl-tRNA synthetase
MKSSVRINNDEYEKESAADFALWKAFDRQKDGENAWKASLMIHGEKHEIMGRPGWHIECSACSRFFFGDQMDIHMGAIDNIFPHHQNEIAQSEAFSGLKPFSKYWLHTGHLLVDNKKMSKSAGNFYTFSDMLDQSQLSVGILSRSFRLMILQCKYRDNFNFTFDKLQIAASTIE